MEYFLGYAPQTPNLISVSDLIWVRWVGESWGLYSIAENFPIQIFLGSLAWSLGSSSLVWTMRRTLYFWSYSSPNQICDPSPTCTSWMKLENVSCLGEKKNPISTPFLSTGLLDRFPDSEGFNWRLRAARGRFLFIQHWTAGNWAYQVWRKMKSMSKWTPCVLPQEGQTVLQNNQLVRNTC